MSKGTIKLIESKIPYIRIGIGGFAVVFKAKDKALKIFYEKNLYRHSVSNEIRMLRQLKHPNIPKLYSTGRIDNQYPFILLEYINGITLYELSSLNRVIKNIIPKDIIIAILLQSAEVLSYLHSKNIVHRDINPTSFMISKEGTLKFIDFATTKTVRGDFLRTAGMSYEYQAPEQIINKTTFLKSDIWSLGATIHHLITNKHLFDDKTVDQIKIDRIIIPPCSYKLRKFLELMLQKDISKRISSSELEQEVKKLMSRQESERLLKDFVSHYLNSPTCQAYLDKARNSYPFEPIFLSPFIEKAQMEREPQVIAV